MRERRLGCLVLAVIAAGCAPAAPAPARPSATSFISLLERAADAAPAGVVPSDPTTPEGAVLHGSGRMPSSRGSRERSTGDEESWSCVHAELRRMDWRKAVAAAPLGAPGVAVAHADAQAAVLAEAGFIPLDAGWSATNTGGESVRWEVSGPDSFSGASAALQPFRLVHRRIYYAPGTSAFVIARNDYEGASGAVTVELTCVEATPNAAAMDPSLTVPVRETLTLPR